MRRRGFKTYLAISALSLAIFGLFCAYWATRPDRDLVFVREVPTTLPAETLQLSIHSIANWPEWFYSVSKAERIDLMERPFPLSQQIAVVGAWIRLDIQKHKGERRGSFQMVTQVSEYEPGKRIKLSLVRDQSGRILKLFDRVEWNIELMPDGHPVIRGTETAHTQHWRARLFSILSERILMNQLFYPNIMALGQFTQPQAPNPYPAYGS